jgi:hypothetical protein
MSKKIKKSEIKKLKPIQIKKTNKHKLVGILKPSENLDSLTKKETKTEVEQKEIKHGQENPSDTLDSLGRIEKKRKEKEELESLKNLDKNKIFDETKEFSVEPHEINDEKIDNLEDFASSIPLSPREEKFDTPYATSTNAPYGASSSSYSANLSYSSSGSYSGQELNDPLAMNRNRPMGAPRQDFRNSQADYESQKKEDFQRSTTDRKRKIDESSGHPMQRKSRRMGI